jgi:hypothetical protein
MSYRHSTHSICSCSKAVYKPVWRIPLLSVQWINSWWWTDELSETFIVSCQNKFVKLVHLFGFIIKKFVTMQRGHVKVKKNIELQLILKAPEDLYLKKFKILTFQITLKCGWILAAWKFKFLKWCAAKVMPIIMTHFVS